MSYHHSAGSHNAQEALDLAWSAYKAGDSKALHKILAQIGSAYGITDRATLSDRLKIADSIRAYRYPELENITEDLRREFALVAAWRSILFGTQAVWEYTSQVWDRSDLLATIIGTQYTLHVEPKIILGGAAGDAAKHQSPMELPFPYEQRVGLWPELTTLLRLSFAARSVFVRAMRYVSIQSGGLVEYRLIGLTGVLELERGLVELAEVGLVDPNLDMSDLLMTVTLKDLKQFAFERGLESHGSKHRLIETILRHVGEPEATSVLGLAGAQQQARVLVTNLASLKKHVYSELNRFYWYMQWVEHAHCLVLPPQKAAAPQSPSTNKNMEPWARWPNDPLAYLHESWNQAEIRLVRGTWDAECDKIVKDLANRYAWDAGFYIKDAVEEYLPPDRLEAFKQACERKAAHVWYNVLMYYGEARIAELGIGIKEPRRVTCASCGSQLIEWSIPARLAQRVGYRIHFCADCYSKALEGVGKPPEPRERTDMLSHLVALASTLTTIPSASFMKRPDLASVSDETQISVVELLLAMSPYEAYVKAFGSWFEALVLAGILEGDTQRLSRGTRCIANDGHVCLSLSEKAIDDWLNAHGIPHGKEPLYPRHSRLNPTGRIRGDWQVGKVIIEYAGLMDEPEYFAKIETKRDLAMNLGFSLIIIEPEDILNLDTKLGQLAILPTSDQLLTTRG